MMKREPGACGYIWATLSRGDIDTGTWCSRVWVLKARLATLLFKKIVVERPIDGENRTV
jgi:hypothetical protein